MNRVVKHNMITTWGYVGLCRAMYISPLLSQPIFQCYLLSGTQFHQSIVVSILHYSANLVLTLSYLSKTPRLK